MSITVELPDPIDLRTQSDQRTYATGPKGEHLYGVFEHIRQRAWSEITGIVLHQTACLMGERPARFLSTGAHYVVTRAGLRIRLHELTDRIVSANGFNARCVSIEIDGQYAGDDSTPERGLATTWDDPTTAVREQPMILTKPSVAATRAVIREIDAEVKSHGGRVKYMLSHRQSSETRQNDPGAAPWREIGIPMIAELGYNLPSSTFDPATFKIDDGRTIPACWNPAYVKNRY